MSNVDDIVIEIKKKVDDVIQKCRVYGEDESKFRDDANSHYEKTKIPTSLAIAIGSANNLVMNARLGQTLSCLKMSLSLVDYLNAIIEKLATEFPEKLENIRSELKGKVEEQLSPINAKYQQEKAIEDEVNRAAKEREGIIGDMFG